MSPEDQKDLSRRSIGLWSSESTDRLDDLVAPGYINHQEPHAAGGERSVGLEDWKEVIEGYHQAFSESQVRILTEIAEGALVTVHWEFTAKHTGEYLGRAGSGKFATRRGITIDRFEDGKIIETWTVWDKSGMFEDLGFVS